MHTTRALGSAYLLQELLGTGAMGQVWVAVDQRDGRRLAAKVLREEMARDPEIVARFVQERSILLALDHPHVVRVRDLVVEGDALAIVMDLVEGSDLRHRLRAQGTLAPVEAVTLAAQVLDALAAAHALGILHRDVKPDNVLIGAEGQALLTDFSIARLAQETTVRMTGVLGTAEYIAPEVFESEQVSGAADVYGAGTLLYELLAGRTPFAGGGTGYAIANRHVRSAPPVVPDLDPALQRWLLALLDKDPTRRPTAAAAAAALQELLPGLAGQPALPVQPEPTSWAQVAGAGPETALHVAGASAGTGAVDPGQTTVRASAAAAVGPAPVEPGEARWAGPQGEAGPDLSLTQVRAEPRVERSRLDDAVDRRPEQPQQKRSRALPWVAGVAAVGLVAGGAALLLTRDGKATAPERTAAPVARDLITVALPPQVLPSGLSITREASLDPETSTATTTVTWTAGATPLAGPFYEVVAPAEDGGECPTVAWDATALRDTTEGLAAEACGWRVATEPLTAGGSAAASYDQRFEVPEGEEPSTVLRARLAAAEKATVDALTGLAVSPAYAPQRLDGLRVEIGGAVTVGATFDVSVLPVWLGVDEPDGVNALLSSRSGQASNLLRQLGGSLSLTSEECSGAIAFRANRPYANTVARDCTVTARLGALTERSRGFDVVQRSTGSS